MVPHANAASHSRRLKASAISGSSRRATPRYPLRTIGAGLEPTERGLEPGLPRHRFDVKDALAPVYAQIIDFLPSLLFGRPVIEIEDRARYERDRMEPLPLPINRR